MPEGEGSPLHPETPLTQYGRTDSTGFRVRPRAGVEQGISLIAGRLSAAEARHLVVRRGFYRPGVDTARYTTVQHLLDGGFAVRRDPTPAIADHVLVEYQDEWDDEVAQRFDDCFGSPEEEP